VSQYLSGTRIRLDTVRMSESTLPPEQREALATASQMLDVSRLEVRNAIDNLRNDDILTMRLDERLALHARRIRSARLAEVETSLAEMPDLSPKVKGDVLAVVQEAVSNAVRHGRAQHLRIEAARAGARGYVVRILNDGLPFDAGRAPGSTTGHFGLDSMRERGERSGFAVSFGEDGGWNCAELRGEAGR
jgi:signal transduction histidine kinase